MRDTRRAEAPSAPDRGAAPGPADDHHAQATRRIRASRNADLDAAVLDLAAAQAHALLAVADSINELVDTVRDLRPAP